jgi:tetratricopeptide (TPR) repeat protein
MKNQGIFILALGIAVFSQACLQAEAARKYYPPGFTPPSDQKLVPSSTPPEPQPQVIIQQIPGSKQVIIKTVPVKVEKVVSQPAKPRDPLLVLMDEQRYFDALRLVDARLKKSPNNISLQMMRGRILREQRDYLQSVNQFQNILEKSRSKSVKADAWDGIGWTYYQKALRDKRIGDVSAADISLQAAEAAFRQATQLQPNLSRSWAGLGEIMLINEDLTEAERFIKKAKRLAPNTLTVQLAEANLLLAQNKPGEALQILYGIKKTTTREPNVFLLLARGSLAEGKVDDAIINLKQLLELVPDHSDALKLLSQSYELKMKPQDAEVTLEKAIALNPMDENSVASLLKIYNQRHEIERGNLLLKTLLKDQPGQAAYGYALMQRLYQEGAWEEMYEEGRSIVGPILANESETEQEKLAVVSLFAKAVHQKGRGMLDRQALLKEPTIQKAKTYSQEHLGRVISDPQPQAREAALQDRLNLLLMEPLVAVPPLPTDFMPTESELPLALQIAFLQGNKAAHQKWLDYAHRVAERQKIAEQLYSIGDYEGALYIVDRVLADNPQDKSAQLLKERLLADQKDMKEQLASLSMLPRKISDSYWRKAATDVLRLGSGDWKTHALIGEALVKRHHPELALTHQRLAARYAPTAKDKQYWMRKADKTARSLSRNR